MADHTAHVRDQLDLYLTGALDTERERHVERHLFTCPTCRVEADQASEVALELTVASAPPGDEPDPAPTIAPRP
ncbi:anti-sigma factor [Plantactinospora sp. KBS50]|uniref:anti-sigma factor family protein n=1 Tax=Plantactinospora sp. KBS50 TaxID=2024580 RepID=UPI0012FD22D5|nr:zf-HC2 domain-containing protein [Plantactinospora sp. KBS50]